MGKNRYPLQTHKPTAFSSVGVFLLLLVMSCFFRASYGQQPEVVDTATIIFDYFRQGQYSNIDEIGKIDLRVMDSLDYKTNAIYNIVKTDTVNGWLKISFKGQLLYKYKILNNHIEGTGFCYYPFADRVAVQGNFRNGKLDGLVFELDIDGSVIEVLLYANGKYIKHIYSYDSNNSKNSLRRITKGVKSDPLRNEGEVILYDE